MEADFSGYATKAGIRCSDGRTIMPDAFKHQDTETVPLMWQHKHDDPQNVLGKAILEHRDDGIYAYGFFNDTENGIASKKLVQHGNIVSLSIYANELVEKGKNVVHGTIRELSLVVAGANPGALIDNDSIRHGDGSYDTIDDAATIYSGEPLEHGALGEKVSSPKDLLAEKEGDQPKPEDQPNDKPEDKDDAPKPEDDKSLEHAATDEKTVQDVYEEMTDEQKTVVHFMLGSAIEDAKSAQHSDITNNEDTLAHQEGTEDMSRNVFDRSNERDSKAVLAHSAINQSMESIIDIAKSGNGSFKDAFLAHVDAQDYGIQDIDILFPDAKTLTSTPDLISRRTEWVAGVIDGAKHSPFSRIKSIHADVTAEEARAKGYVKGNLKKDEVIKLLKRVTTPTTVYKKQKLDRDDIVDITDLDVVAWLKWEMRFMLEEELARAILIGDGREPDDDDKIDEEKLRPIAYDHDMYTHKVTLPANTDPEGIVESVLRARKHYKGTGQPAFYTTDDILTDMILLKDRVGRRLYNTEAELAAALRVSKIVVVEVMEDNPDLLGIIVNIADYTIGADRGGSLTMFDDFDIDVNQYKYLMETRVSGTLTKAKSAVVIRRTSGTTVSPAVPEFDAETGELLVPQVSGVSYYDITDITSETKLTSGQVVTVSRITDIEARPDAGYNFPHNTDNDWTFAPKN